MLTATPEQVTLGRTVHTTAVVKVDVHALGDAAREHINKLVAFDARLSLLDGTKEFADFTRFYVQGHLMMGYSTRQTRGAVMEAAKLFMQNLVRTFAEADPSIYTRTFSHVQATLNIEDCERIESGPEHQRVQAKRQANLYRRGAHRK